MACLSHSEPAAETWRPGDHPPNRMYTPSGIIPCMAVCGALEPDYPLNKALRGLTACLRRFATNQPQMTAGSSAGPLVGVLLHKMQGITEARNRIHCHVQPDLYQSFSLLTHCQTSASGSRRTHLFGTSMAHISFTLHGLKPSGHSRNVQTELLRDPSAAGPLIQTSKACCKGVWLNKSGTSWQQFKGRLSRAFP